MESSGRGMTQRATLPDETTGLETNRHRGQLVQGMSPQEDDFESKLDVSFDDYILNLFLVNSER